MSYHNLIGIAASDLTTISGNPIAAGESLVLNSDWSSWTHAIQFEFSDSFDSALNGDNVNNEYGDDLDQYLTVWDADGYMVDSGLGYAENRITLQAPDGSLINIYTIEIGGVYHGALVDGQLTPGVHYTVTSVTNVDTFNSPSYLDIDDQLYDNADSNFIEGGDGDESLIGGAGNDDIDAGAGNNTVYAGAGDDTIDDTNGATDTGNNEFHGGAGNDTIWAGGGNSTIYGDSGNDYINGETGAHTIDGGSGSDTIYGGTGGDSILGGSGADYVSGGTGNDTIYGGSDGTGSLSSGGTNTIGSQFTVIHLGTASDVDVNEGDGYSEYASNLLGTYGGPGNELYGSIQDAQTYDTNLDGLVQDNDHYGSAETIVINGVSCYVDSLQVYSATVTFVDGSTGTFSAVVFQTTTGEVFLAPEYTDNADNSLLSSAPIQSITLNSVLETDTTLIAERVDTDWQIPGEDVSADTLLGGDGNDLIYGEAGADSIVGGAGWDTIYGGSGNDTISGGSEEDLIYGGDGDDHLTGNLDDDTIYAGDGQDKLIGGIGADLLYGEAGNDTLLGGADNDTLYGGSGDDTLQGDQGDDYFYGQAGNDTYRLTQGSGNDTVADFDLNDDDLDGFTNDQIDVSYLRDLDGEAVETWDVQVSDDGLGNALLTFPNGETLLLKGVSPETASQPGQLYSMGVPCFVGGTRIATPKGQVPVEELKAGDLVVCADGRMQAIRWAGSRHLCEDELTENPELRPVVIKKGAIGNDRELRLSPQHAVALKEDGEITLARALHLAERDEGAFRVAQGVKTVSYHHLLLPGHALVLAEGAVVETMWPGPVAMKALGPRAQLEIAKVAPALIPALNGEIQVEEVYGPRAGRLLKRREVAALREIETCKDICLQLPSPGQFAA